MGVLKKYRGARTTAIILFYAYCKMSMSYLPPTKLQTRILQEYVDVKGFGEGQRRLYHRLKNDIGERDHPAMDANGNVAYKNGNVLELLQDPPTTRDNTYIYEGKRYTYETRMIFRFGKESIERRMGECVIRATSWSAVVISCATSVVAVGGREHLR